MSEKETSKARVIIGLMFIVGGTLALLNSLNIEVPQYIRDILSWKYLFIGVGIFQLFRKEFTSATILLCLGSFFILREYEQYKNLFWPIVTIGVGLVILLNSFKSRRKKDKSLSSDKTDIFSFFGGVSKKVTAKDFKKADALAMFGSAEIDLRDCEMDENGATIELVSIFGGVSVIVPRDWKVDISVTSVLGGFKDDRDHLIESNSPEKVLRIKGSVILGGGELKTE